jgi:hypothetical protein
MSQRQVIIVNYRFLEEIWKEGGGDCKFALG